MLFLLVVISTERILHLLPPSEWRQKRHCASSAFVSLVYLASMTDFDCDDDQLVVTDFCNQSEVRDAIPPILSEVSSESLPVDARIFAIDQIAFHPLDYAIARAAVQFLKRLVKLLGRYQSTMKPQEVKPKAQTDWLGFCKGGAQCPRNGRLCV